MRMLSWIATASIMGAATLASAPAQASGGCAWGYHPTLFGCHVNAPGRVVVAPAVAIAPRVVVVPRPMYYPYYPHRYWHPYAW